MRSALLAAAACLTLLVAESDAQFVYVTNYAPAPVYVAPPAPTVVYRPVAPAVAYSPVVAAPPVAVATPTVVASPVVTTRYRPFLGRTVSRVRYYYTPTTVVTPLY